MGTDPRDWAREVIRIEAEACARNYGLEAERVVGIFDRLARHRLGDPLPEDPDIVDTLAWLLRRPTPLDHALRYLPADAALALCEAEDLGVLEGRVALVEYLSDEQTPLYSLDELGRLVVAFGAHLERNRPHLVRTGHPVSAFRPSPWLGMQLAPLYPVKLPLDIDSTADERGEATFTYTWPRRPARHLGLPRHLGPYYFVGGGRGYLHGPGGKMFDDDGQPVDACSYEEAALIEGVSAEDAARPEAGRAGLLELKTRVLGHLGAAIRARDAAAVWPGALRLLIEAAPAEEAEFYLRMDRFFRGYDVRLGLTSGEETELNPGGLTALLEVVGHCEKELSIGTMATTRHRLLALTGSEPIVSYYQVVGQPDRADFDAVLDGFARLEAREASFWQDYRARVTRALAEEFYEEVIVRTKVKRKFAATFEPQIKTFAEWQRGHQEATGALPALQIGPASVESAVNVFRRDGDCWTLSFEGRTAPPVRDSVGLRRVALLLRYPHREFAADKLVRATSDRASGGAVASPQVSEAELAAEGLRVSGLGDAGEILDEQAERQYRGDIEDLRAERDEAARNNDPERVRILQERIDAILDQLAAARGLGGRRRTSSDANERARKTAGNSIRDSVSKIQRVHPALGAHLSTTIKEKEGTFSYQPPEPVRWQL